MVDRRGRLPRTAAGILIAVLLYRFGVPLAWAELATTVDLHCMNVLSHMPAGSPNGDGNTEADTGVGSTGALPDGYALGNDTPLTFLLQGSGEVEFRAVGNRNVKAELALRTVIGQSLLLDIPRGFIKVRFPAFRVTVGKTRVSWGEGVMFNAGDLIFGSTDLSVDLSADVLRDDNKLLTEVYIPLGTFSYVEGVVTAPEIDLAAMAAAPATDSAAGMPDIKETSAGVKVQAKPLNLKVESGYWYAGKDRLHRFFGVLQGAFGDVDWHLSAASGVPDSAPAWIDLWELLTVSAGMSTILKLTRDDSVPLRLEALSYPAGLWSESEGGLGTDEDGTLQRYGLYLYPEISIAVGQTVGLMWRTILSPLDQSLSMTVGGNWNIYQGFHLFAYGIVQAGDQDDIFGWPRAGDLALMTGMRFVF